MFLPHTDSEREEMLQTIGLQKLEDMFQSVPEEHRFPDLDLPPALTEMEAFGQVQELSLANESTQDLACFLGAGAYNHYTPAVVDNLLRRGEFLTAYTPYQPEISQGTLQVIFEYQSLITLLTGMEISNASHYDGATATAEAAVQAFHTFRRKKKKIVLSPGVHPHYRATLRTYLGGYDDLEIVGDNPDSSPFTTPEELLAQVDGNTSIVIVQYPDFFGRIYNYEKLAESVHEAGALLAIVANPLALGMLKPPGEFGADIVCGDGQPLGIPLSYGGPYLGYYATTEKHLRKIAGRLAGATVDQEGNRGYVLTLTAREQHIRREKASSNICTNQGLISLASTIYMSLLGKHGMKQVAESCYHKAQYAAEKIAAIPGYELADKTPFFHEFVITCPRPVEEINMYLLDQGILGGYDISQEYPSQQNQMLISVTEKNTREEIDALCEALQEVSND